MRSASAPAKIILFGEHAVVYGRPAIAVPVSALRATAEIEAPEVSGQGLILEASDLGQRLPVNVDSTAIDNALTLTARLVLDYLQIPPPDLTLRIRSDIPMASGLGSGAAVAAASARALALAAGRPLPDDALSQLVYEVEKLNHGTPSGIDNTVVVYERPVFFVRGAAIETVTAGAPFRFLVADTGRGAPTKVAVGDVRRLYEQDPGAIEPVLDAIGAIAVQARAAMERGDAATLGPLMLRNHELLGQLTVSSPELDRLVGAAKDAGALGAKLSGGGRGGNMIALVTDETASRVRQALTAAGARRVFETVVGAAEKKPER